MLMLLVLSADAARAQSADGIKGVDDAWVAAAKRGDVEAIVALYAPDAVYYPPDAFEVRGAAAIRKAYTDWFGGTRGGGNSADGAAGNAGAGGGGGGAGDSAGGSGGSGSG